LEQDCTYLQTINAFQDLDIRLTTLYTWVKEYKQLLLIYGNDEKGIELERQDFLKSKRGRQGILPEQLELDLIENIISIRQVGGKITPKSVSILAKATVINSDLPDEMKETIKNKTGVHWARDLLERMGYTKRKQTTDRILTFDELNLAKNSMMSIMYRLNNSNPNLVLMMDETMAAYSPVESYTYAPKGDKEIKLKSFSTKKGCTATFTITKSNVLLPVQIIWEGLSTRSIPKYKSPTGFINVYAGATAQYGSKTKTNKWQNRKTIVEYISFIIVPYVKTIRAQLSSTEPALLLMDNHWSHLDPVIQEPLEQHNIIPLYIPANSTHLFCVLDLAINKPFKTYYREEYDSYCTDYLSKQLRIKKPDKISMKLSLTILKPLVGKWISAAFLKIKAKEEEIISNGWKQLESNLN